MPLPSEAYYLGAPGAAAPSAGNERQRVREALTHDAAAVVLVLVGLPARGKSFISRKMENFLRWRALETRMFNVGKYRRGLAAPGESGRSNFFDTSNQAAKAAREAAAVEALADVLAYLDGGGKIAIFDATNSTSTRRSMIRQRVQEHNAGYSVIFVEVLCNDRCVVDANMRNKVIHSPDFANMGIEEALEDLRARIAKYESVYETVQDHEGAFIKLYDLSSKVMAQHCYGRISKSMLPFLMAIHIGSRPIWLVRAGAGEANPKSPGGGDRLHRLSYHGRSFAESLEKFVRRRTEEYWEGAGKAAQPTQVYTSTMPRATASVRCATLKHEQTSVLNPIDKGAIGGGFWDIECIGDVPPWAEVEERHPEFWAEFRKELGSPAQRQHPLNSPQESLGELILEREDPLRCRFPGGESYMDVMRRLEGLLIEVEMCTRPVLIVSHITTLQLILAYLRGTPIEDAWSCPVPKNAVIEAKPSLGGGFLVEEHLLISSASASPSSPAEPETGSGSDVGAATTPSKARLSSPSEAVSTQKRLTGCDDAEESSIALQDRDIGNSAKRARV